MSVHLLVCCNTCTAELVMDMRDGFTTPDDVVMAKMANQWGGGVTTDLCPSCYRELVFSTD